MEGDLKSSKLSLTLKQTSKGFWYVGSLRIDGENIYEIDNLMESSLNILRKRVNNLNSNKKEKEPPKKVPEIFLNSAEEKLFNDLKEARNQIASEEGYPPYIVFHDSVLKKFAKHKPRTREAMLNIDGVGEAKLEKYGERFLSILRNVISWD